MPKRVRLEPHQVQRLVRDLAPGDVGFVMSGSVYATRPEGWVWISAQTQVEPEAGLLDNARIKRLKRGVRIFVPDGTLFRLKDDHQPDDLPVIRVDYEEVEDEEQAGEP